MAYTIWKEILQPLNTQQVMLPEGAEILHAGKQYNQICIWFRCDPSKLKVPRLIAICGTGHAAPGHEEARYLGTVSLMEGQIITHVFERT